MEERMLEEEDSRRIKLKRTPDGEVDALEVDGEEIDVTLEFPVYGEDEEYDEDMVGLTDEQFAQRVKEHAAKKAAARKRAEGIAIQADVLLQAEQFEQAEKLFREATLGDDENVAYHQKKWQACTHNFSKTDVFYRREISKDAAQSSAEVREYLLEKVGESLRAERARLEAQAQPIRDPFLKAQAERRKIFLANRNFYLLRTALIWAFFLAVAIACGVVACFITATLDVAPVVSVIVMGVIAFILLVVGLLFLRLFINANRLYRANEQYSSTEDGKKLQEFEEKIARIDEVLEGERE